MRKFMNRLQQSKKFFFKNQQMQSAWSVNESIGSFIKDFQSKKQNKDDWIRANFDEEIFS